VRRVYCLGRNYVAHAEEMGDDPNTAPPFFFMKPTDAVCPAREGFQYPTMGSRVGYEIELVVALKSGGRDIARQDALMHVYGYGVGLDMTRRDLQDAAKERRRPWEAGKSFDGSAPTGLLKPVSMTGHPNQRRIWLSINGDVRQDSNTSMLRWDIAESIAILSRYFALEAGDLIYSGTPAGVGLVERGDIIRGGVDGIDEIEVDVI
jgi:fumarylpyruvate hydrolase